MGASYGERVFWEKKANFSVPELIVPLFVFSLALLLPARLTFNNTLDAVYWTLPSETTKILHPYKITWAFRVGKGVPSGTVVPIGVVIEDDNTPEFLVELRVLVK